MARITYRKTRKGETIEMRAGKGEDLRDVIAEMAKSSAPLLAPALGAANDDDERVRIEIGAAELAAFPDASWVDDPAWESCSYGVLCFHNGGTPGCDDDGGCSLFAEAEWVGYLAAAILEHEQYDISTAEARRKPRSPIERMVDEACGVSP